MQNIPDELREIAEAVKGGKRETKKLKGRFGVLSGDQGGFDQVHKQTYGVEADGNILAKW